MIQANELRIGNWVYYQSVGNRVKINADIFCSLLSDDGLLMLHKVQPIPLTPEILEDAGFELIKGYYEKSNLSFWLRDDNNRLQFTYASADTNVIQLDSLHQLQNLYFALTGKELEINL